MVYKLGLALLLLSSTAVGQSYKKLHQKAVVIDTHNDVLSAMMDGANIELNLTGKTHTDIPRLKAGGVDDRGQPRLPG
jgi:membrane dipeptidase